MITVFTPTYNRAYIIGNLYTSLCKQTCEDFEWLVVDDGSTDRTEALIQTYITEGKITVRYFKQKNQGKHVAINKGVCEAKGELFFIVDSDDYLSTDAIEKVLFYYRQVEHDYLFAGISGIRTTFTGKRIGGKIKNGILDCSSLDLRLRYHVEGDMAEVYRTSILKKYPFPVFEGESFCPEALIWNRISLNYKLRFVDEEIYFCEYRPDGLTAKIIRLRMESPRASMLYYSELYRMHIPFLQKLKAAINYWRFAFCSQSSFSLKLGQIGFETLGLLPIGFFFHLRDLHS